MRILLLILVIAIGMTVAAEAYGLKMTVIKSHNEQLAAYVALISDQGAP